MCSSYRNRNHLLNGTYLLIFFTNDWNDTSKQIDSFPISKSAQSHNGNYLKYKCMYHYHIIFLFFLNLLLLSFLFDVSGVNKEQSVALGMTETWLAGTLALNTVFSFLKIIVGNVHFLNEIFRFLKYPVWETQMQWLHPASVISKILLVNVEERSANPFKEWSVNTVC